MSNAYERAQAWLESLDDNQPQYLPLAHKNAAMEELLEETMEVFKKYINVPEAAALREKWERLKDQ